MNLLKQYIVIFLAVLVTACGGSGGDSTPTPGIAATPSSATIAENTSTTFDVVLRTEPVEDVIILVSSNDYGEATTSVSSLTFTSSSGGGDLWNVPQTVTISGALDNAADGNQNINIVLDPINSADVNYAALSPTALATTVSDIDSAGFTVVGSGLSTDENGATADFTVVINTIPTGNVIVDVLSTDVSEGTVSVSQLNFDSTNWQTPQTVTVSPVIDSIVDGNQTYNVTLNVNGNTTDTSGYADLTLAPVSVTNTDNDAVGFTVSTTSLGTTENGSAVTYTVVLNTMPNEVVDVDVVSVDTGEGAVSPALLSFDNSSWNIPQTVTISPVDDSIADGNQAYNVTMDVNLINTVDTSGYADLIFTPVVVTNADDDTAGVTISTTTLSTIENGTTTSYTVVLNTEPVGSVVIDIASTNTAEGEVSVSQIVFDNIDWQTPQPITVLPVDDLIVDGNQTYDITNSINGSTDDTTGYAVLTLPSVSVTNADDDPTFVTEGTAATPLALAFGTDLPYTGSVDTTASYYEISNLTPGDTYSISLTGMTDDADIYVYTDAFTTEVCKPWLVGTVDEVCPSIITTTGSVWVMVDGTWATANGGTGFNLDVTWVSSPVPPLVTDFNSTAPVALLDPGTITDTIAVTGAPTVLAQVEVLLDITHTYDEDLTITLISPTGTRVILSDFNGWDGDNYTGTSFSESATISIVAGTAPFSGWYLPQQSLALLNGENGNGTWTLEIVDTTSPDTGTLNSWGLKLQ